MLVPPRLRGGPVVRGLALVAGLFLFALGIVLQLESDLGLSPWDVLNQGLSEHTALSFGAANATIAVVVLGVSWLLGARIGIGTVANAVLIGAFVDLLLRSDRLATLADQPLGVRIALLVAGIAVVGAGSGLYLGADVGAGPRDSLMLVTAKRTGIRIGTVRALIEVAVAVVGFALGGSLGVGTLAFAIGIGPAVELSFVTLVALRLTEPGTRTLAPGRSAVTIDGMSESGKTT